MALLLACVVVFVYSLGLMTDLHDALRYSIRDPEDLESASITGARIFYDMQPFNREFTMYSIILLLVNLIVFVTGTNSRRRYYIGNYISVAVSTIANVLMTVWAMPQILAFKKQFVTTVNFEEMKSFAEKRKTLYTESTFTFDVGYAVFGFLLLITLLLIINTVLKIIMMKEEKRLIGSRKDGRA